MFEVKSDLDTFASTYDKYFSHLGESCAWIDMFGNRKLWSFYREEGINLLIGL
jgi:hypothetical protein